MISCIVVKSFYSFMIYSVALEYEVDFLDHLIKSSNS
jgi:hypothetical protein